MNSVLLTPIQTKFLKKIKIENDCWLWQGSKNKVTGYGMFVLNHKLTSSHRASYKLFKGEINHVIHHLCNNKICVNPEHLEDITQRENLLRTDGFLSKSRATWNSKKTHCPKGHEYREIMQNHKKRRFCPTCRSASKEIAYCGIDLSKQIENKKELKKSQTKLQDPVTKQELERMFNLVSTKFGIGVFRQAVRVLLFMRGINCYQPDVVQCQRVLATLFQDKEINLYDVASLLDLHETITKNKKKLPDDLTGDTKK